MATKTLNYELNKPAQTDFYNIDVQNENMDKIDEALGKKVDSETGKGLSTNDYNDIDKEKVKNLPDNTITELEKKTNQSDFQEHIEDKDIHTSSSEKQSWNETIENLTAKVEGNELKINTHQTKITALESGYEQNLTKIESIKTTIAENSNKITELENKSNSGGNSTSWLTSKKVKIFSYDSLDFSYFTENIANCVVSTGTDVNIEYIQKNISDCDVVIIVGDLGYCTTTVLDNFIDIVNNFLKSCEKDVIWCTQPYNRDFFNINSDNFDLNMSTAVIYNACSYYKKLCICSFGVPLNNIGFGLFKKIENYDTAFTLLPNKTNIISYENAKHFKILSRGNYDGGSEITAAYCNYFYITTFLSGEIEIRASFYFPTSTALSNYFTGILVELSDYVENITKIPLGYSWQGVKLTYGVTNWDYGFVTRVEHTNSYNRIKIVATDAITNATGKGQYMFTIKYGRFSYLKSTS